jgi:ABC-type glutathione transport system ATPase component
MSTVIRAEDLCVTLKIPRRPEKELVRHVNFEVQRGECLGILGESGSGKSMSIKAMLGLLDKNFSVSGHAWFGEKDLLKESGESMRKIRGSEIAVVLQNPMTCFDPLYRIGSQIGETFATHTDWNANEIREKSLETLERITQYEILEEFVRIKKEHDTAMIFITHDLGAISKVADDLVVMNSGTIADRGSFSHILHHASDPYTRLLVEKRSAVMKKYRESIGHENGGAA